MKKKIEIVKWFFLSNRLAFLIFLILILLIYGKTLGYDFIYDDHETIEYNDHAHSLKNFYRFFYDSETSSKSHLKYEIYRPIKNLTNSILYFFLKANPFGYHVLNLLLHLLVVFLFYVILKSFGFSLKKSFLSATIFCIHPALTHNVSYISGNADILAAFFLLLSIYFLIRKTEKVWLSGLFFAFACFSKETPVMFPFFLFIVSLSHKKKLPVIHFFSIAILYILIRFYVLEGNVAQTNYWGNSIWITQMTMIKVWAYYFLGIIWPLKTHIIPVVGIEHSFFNLRILFSSLVLCSLFVALFKTRKHPYIRYSLLWFFLFLFPVANIIPINALMSWRFAYIPWMGMTVFFTTFFEEYFLKHEKIRRNAFFFLIPWLFSLVLYSRIIVERFQNDLTLWTPLMSEYPQLSKPYRVVSNHYLSKGNKEKAQIILEEGLIKNPADPFLLHDAAKIHLLTGDCFIAFKKLNQIKEEDQKVLGDDYLYDFVFAAFHLEKSWQIVEKLKERPPGSLPTKILLLFAHALVLERKSSEAIIAYEDLLLRRDLTKREFNDCVYILSSLKSKSNAIKN